MFFTRCSPLYYLAIVTLAWAFFVPFTTAQDTAVLTQDSSYTVLQDQTTYIQGVLRDGNTTYMFSQFNPTLFWVDISLLKPTTQDGDGSIPITTLAVDSNSANVVLFGGFLDSATKCIYMVGGEKIYKANITAMNTTSVIAPLSFRYNVFSTFVDVQNRWGYFISTQTPGSISRMSLDLFNASFITNFPIQSGNVYASVFDNETQIVWLAAYDGALEKISLLNQTTLVYNDNLTNVHSKVLVRDALRHKLYLCYDQIGGGPQINIYSENLELIQALALPSLPDSQCASGIFDFGRGQAFFASAGSGSALVLTVNLATGLVTGYEPVVADVPQIAAQAIRTTDRTLYVVTQTQLVMMTYESNCPNDCSNHGVCDYGNCTCDEGWLTEDCSVKRCDYDCNNHGTCANGLCICFSNYTGFNCSQRQCINDCSGHGSCTNEPNYLCVCAGGWSGIDCSVAPPAAPPPVCPELHGYKDCIAHRYCGWCGDTRRGRCLEGNLEGPVDGSCIEWNFNQNPEVGIVILIIIFLAILGCMLLINIYSAVRLDIKRAKDFESEYKSGVAVKPTVQEAAIMWWRDQRSAKSWSMFEQFQFFTWFTHLALAYPTRILSMTRFVDWTNLGIPLPFMKDHTQHIEKRTLLGMVQYANGLDILPTDIYANNMFWFGISILSLSFVFGVLVLCTWRKAHWKTVFICRYIYLMVRLLNLAYMGIVVTCCYTMVAAPHHPRTVVPAIFTFIIVGIGYPLAIYFRLRGKDKELINTEFRLKYGALYVNFKPDQKFFYLSIILRKLITGIFVGFLNYSATHNPKWVVLIQAACLAVAQFFYAFEMFRRKPYYDHYHEYLDYFLVIINIGTIALSMLHYNHPLVAGELIVGLVQALGFIACIMAYIISWLQMQPSFKIRQFFARSCFCCGRRKKMAYEDSKSSIQMQESKMSDNVITIS